MKVFEAPYYRGTLIETFGLTATNNNSVTLPQTDKGYAIRLNGSNQSISYTGSVSVKSVIIFLKANGLSKDIIDFDGGTHSIEVGAANITATGFVSPTFYVDTVATAALPNNQWKCVIITTATAFTANAIKIGRETSYFKGDIAYVCFDNAVISASDINDYQKLFTSLRQRGRSKTNFLIPKVTDLSAQKTTISAAYNFINGSVVDITNNSHNGTDSGVPQPTINGKKYKGSPDKTVLGNIGNIKSVSFRIKLASTSEKIMEGAANAQLIYVSSGTLTALDFATKYVDGVAGSTMVANQWHTVTLTSANNVSFSACTLALNNATYGNFEIADLKFYPGTLTLQDAKSYHNQWCKPTYINDFSDEPVGTAVPRGMIKGTGTYTISELTSDVASGTLRLPKGKKYLKCSVAGTIAFPSNMAYGTWEFSVYKGADANGIFLFFINGNTSGILSGSNGYGVYFRPNKSIVVFKNNIGSNSNIFDTSTSYISNTTWYRIRITRTKAGSFTLLIKGGAFTPTAGYDGWTLVSTAGGSGTNPATDTTYSTSNFTVLDLDANDCITDIIYTPEIYQP